MMDQYIVLVYDQESKIWSILMSGPDSDAATQEYNDSLSRNTPAFIIFTGNYVTV